MKLLAVSVVTAIFLVGCGGSSAVKTTKRADARTDLMTEQVDGVADNAIKRTGGEINTKIGNLIGDLFN